MDILRIVFIALLFLNIHLVIISKNNKALIISPSTTASSCTQIFDISHQPTQGYLDKLGFGLHKTGTVFIPFSIAGAIIANDICKAVVVQSDGKILLAGSTKYTDGKTYYALARYLPNGMLDPTFGRVSTPYAGTTFIPFSISGGINDRANSIALQPDGKIVLGGWTNKDGITYFSLARFTCNGELDTTFGQIEDPKTGTCFLPFTITGGQNDQATKITLQSDGKIVASGLSVFDTASYFAIARFMPNGQLDLSFGGENGAPPGTNYIPFGIAGGSLDVATGLAIQSNGSIIIGGYSEDATGLNTYFALSCFTSNGNLDQTFGGYNGSQPGTAYINFSIADLGLTDTTIDIATSLALTADDSILMGGFSTHGRNECSYVSLARFTPKGYLDTSFGKTKTPHAGTICINLTEPRLQTTYHYATNLVLQPNGSILIAGWSSNTNNFTLDESRCYATLARFTTKGLLDPHFGNKGIIHIPFSLSGAHNSKIYETPYAITLQVDQSILLGGRTSEGATQPAYFSLARFTNYQA